MSASGTGLDWTCGCVDTGLGRSSVFKEEDFAEESPLEVAPDTITGEDGAP